MIKLNEPKSERLNKVIDAGMGMSMLLTPPTLGISLMLASPQFALGITVLVAWIALLLGMAIASKVLD
jgi:hypothetical protein